MHNEQLQEWSEQNYMHTQLTALKNEQGYPFDDLLENSYDYVN